METTKSKMSINTIVKIAMLGVMGFVLMFFQFPLPFAPPFMSVDFGDVPSLIGAFALGPVQGIAISFVKIFLSAIIKGTMTGYVGELSNFFVSSVFVFTAGMYYRKHYNFKGAIIGMIIGVISMTILATASNYFVIFPLYATVLGLPINALIGMGTALNSSINSLFTLMLFAVVPFNIVKGTLVALVTTALYKHLSSILKR